MKQKISSFPRLMFPLTASITPGAWAGSADFLAFFNFFFYNPYIPYTYVRLVKVNDLQVYSHRCNTKCKIKITKLYLFFSNFGLRYAYVQIDEYSYYKLGTYLKILSNDRWPKKESFIKPLSIESNSLFLL